MYNASKRMFLACQSVGSLINKLNALPRDAKIRCCGSPCFYLHIDDDKGVICIDTESLDDEYSSNPVTVNNGGK